MDMERLFVEMASIQLQVDESFVPDVGLPSDYPGPHLLAVAHAGRLATLSTEGRRVRPLSPEAGAALLRATRLARQEELETGADTATGRTLTTLKLRVDDARGPSDSFSLSATINHHAPHALPPAWSTALRLMRDALGPLRGPTAEAWDLAMAWTSPVELGPVWEAGGVVRAPHVVTSFAHEGALYLRTSQPPRPSSLYRLAAGTLTRLEDRRVIAPEGQRWLLPCGAGALALHDEWQQPRRLVLRADDDRGVYLQKASS